MTTYDLVALATRVMGGIDVDAGVEVRSHFNAAYPAIHPELGTGAFSWAGSFFFELDEYLNDANARLAGAITRDGLVDSYREFLVEASKQVG